MVVVKTKQTVSSLPSELLIFPLWIPFPPELRIFSQRRRLINELLYKVGKNEREQRTVVRMNYSLPLLRAFSINTLSPIPFSPELPDFIKC